jgi:hypothetical protein
MDADSRHKEIGKDIDHYISQRKGGGLFGWFGKKEQAAQAPAAGPVPDEMPVAQEVAAEPMPAEEPSAEPKKGFWSSWFSGKADEEPVAEQPIEPVVDEDLRELARITLGFIKMADTDARSRIKSSEDFEKFKEILKRRQVIK